MKIFLDTANIDEIRTGVNWGIVDGVTTNPDLISKEAVNGKKYGDIIREILKIVDGPVSVEVVSTKYEGMVEEARKIHGLGDNAVVKIPMTEDGLRAIKTLSSEHINTNCTLVFNPIQALLAAKAGVTYVSPFVGRLDDIGEDGMQIIDMIRTIFNNYIIKTQILVASIRNPIHVLRSAVIGADVVTVPFNVLKSLMKHPKTDEGLAKFLEDWKKVSPDGKLIL
uniref:Transaldolase n=1 Tax=Thermoplasma acidophilum (strain ATCC 25905 / DSM 1728 / JCM 9062 / NBRC 15155 / AMRC-C165) TaxID=273075 RepID=UPI001B8A8C24|nr:Chain A, Transaldolase [Thermoplasma acidophilum DSM 1728]6YRT_B Chain B, Transaldolase [Thermoplasma acidophilum DSM 1728]6YRT_C Chain C, Transaldolase [Thermoplasma acidophilum DSM 1728]6YRT_D Chain D, Transaldolase [Thermoplasma acidophilum DSM 1728]6YRT_E Chain E, Transaldolase [Thermoplasma acidophilum DSM 1728]